MRRILLALGALFWMACGSDEAKVLLVPPGTEAPNAGAGGAGPGAAGPGGAGGSGSPLAVAGNVGAVGGAGAPGDGAESDVIDVTDGDFSVGAPPPVTGASDAGSPQITGLTGPTAVTNGGTALLHVVVSPPIPSPQFVIGLEGDTGYHTLTGADPDGDGIYDISVQVAGEASQTSLVLSVALRDEAGNVGDYKTLSIELVRSGTGDVKVTLSIDRLHDLDLHVIEPSGEEVSFQNDASATGGALDLDSGSNCMASTSNAENIFWPPGGAPAGQYRVTVQNYQQCSPGPIGFTVSVAYDNVVNTYKNTFPDATASEAVGAANVIEIVTFSRGVPIP